MIDFGTVRRGDTVSLARTLTNTGMGALVDDLVGMASGPAAPFALTAPGLGGGIAAGGATTLTFALDTSNAGVFNGSSSIALASHNAA